MSEIFISYRRDDSAGHAGRLFDHLKAVFGQALIFLDVDDIQPGQVFADVIQERIAGCRLPSSSSASGGWKSCGPAPAKIRTTSQARSSRH